ncbi:MAG TPA: DUF4276 family protein, partial [Candidatus Saccharimonadales bacterium]
MTAVHVGIIAEDQSDIEVLKELGRKISGRNFSVSQHYGKGCGSIKTKTPGWCKAFGEKGCKAVVLVHDRDDKDADQLRQDLEAILAASVMKKCYVTIPTEELEAWLLSDMPAIKRALNLEKEPKDIHHPETVPSPKEHLGNLVTSHSKNKSKYYVNTEHNGLIAKEIAISAIELKCPSFAHFKTFIETEIG